MGCSFCYGNHFFLFFFELNASLLDFSGSVSWNIVTLTNGNTHKVVI